MKTPALGVQYLNCVFCEDGHKKTDCTKVMVICKCVALFQQVYTLLMHFKNTLLE